MGGQSRPEPAEPRLIFVDSSAWIAYLARRESAIQRALDSLLDDPSQLASSGLVICEVMQGIRSAAEREILERSLLSLDLLPEPSLATYLRAAELFRAARVRGITVRGTIDCVLAAQCLEADAELLHVDRDFERLARVAPLRIHPASLGRR